MGQEKTRLYKSAMYIKSYKCTSLQKHVVLAAIGLKVFVFIQLLSGTAAMSKHLLHFMHLKCYQDTGHVGWNLILAVLHPVSQKD